MKQFLQLVFHQPYHFFRSRARRRFMWLVLRWANRPRYRALQLRLHGWRLSVPDGPSFVWQYKEIFAENSYHFNAPAQPVILDCGANVGLASLYFKRHYPQATVVAYEADPQVYAHLQRNMHQNGLPDVLCHNRVVWIHDQGVAFASEGADGGSIRHTGASTLLPSIDLSIEMQAYPCIDLLKMDIEGAETEVLLHAEDELWRVQHLFVEYHSYVGQPQELGTLLALLERKGFRYFVRPEADRPEPFINRRNRSNPAMDLQLNIFAYRE